MDEICLSGGLGAPSALFPCGLTSSCSARGGSPLLSAAQKALAKWFAGLLPQLPGCCVAKYMKAVPFSGGEYSQMSD